MQAEGLPPAFELLKDWSIWLVGVQTAVLGLVSFVAGKDGPFKLDEKWTRPAIFCFAGSIIVATWVLGELPTVALRITHPKENFYDLSLIDWWLFKRIPVWVYTAAQHWLFMIGIVFFMLSINRKMKKSRRDAIEQI
ncbi:MAG TPA: hypothetical protein VF634_03880 [Pyrinomonadaceae bacterium]